MKVFVGIPTLLTLCLIPWDAQAQTCSTVDYDGKVGDTSYNSVICCLFLSIIVNTVFYIPGVIFVFTLSIPGGGTLGSDVILN